MQQVVAEAPTRDVLLEVIEDGPARKPGALPIELRRTR